MKQITYGSLFSGGGGFDMGLDAAGMKCVFQVENDKHCLTLLNRHWPDVPKNEIRPCMGLVGGDPCQVRSLATSVQGTSSPDLSGYFLAMAARCEPGWILRENVCAPDVVEFRVALVVLGYYCVVVEANSAAFTGQSRRREFVVGFDQQTILDRFVNACNIAESHKGFGETNGAKTTPLGCLTTHRYRGDTQDGYVFEGPERGLRILSCTEREFLQGWPAGHTDGLSNTARAKIIGNGVTKPVAEWIGRRIAEAMEIPF